MRVIGITGTNGAGKGTIVDYLVKEKGYAHFSVRDFIIKEIRTRNKAITRNNLITVANELRAIHNASYMVEQLYEQAKALGKDAIIESIRTPGEIDALRGKGDFSLFAVDADPKIRYDRAVLRNYETDRVSFDLFIKDEQREMRSTDPNKQNLSKCMEKADYTFANDGSVEELCNQVEGILSEIK